MKRQATKYFLFSAALLTAAGLAFGLGMHRGMAKARFTLVGQTGKPTVLKNFDPNKPLPANIFARIYKAVNPTVVNISTVIQRQPVYYQSPLFYFFNQFNNQPGLMIQPPPEEALGSGFIISSNGLILTNNHVIKGANVIKVQLAEHSHKKYRATVLGHDLRTDVALIKIDPGFKLPVAQLGSSKNIQVGQWVAALGNPFGYGHTISHGIISAKDRNLASLNRFPFLQTDTSINPGNSGGPLVNMQGQVIGINTAIVGHAAHGIGFAIPIDDVKSVLTQLEQYGEVRHGYIGVYLENLSPAESQYFGISKGALVKSVEPRSPASRAGIHPMDVITGINKKTVRNTLDVSDYISDATIGSIVHISILRRGHKLTVPVKIAESKTVAPPTRQESQIKRYAGEKAPYNLGFRVANSTPHLRKLMGLTSAPHKPVVIGVEPNSLSEQAGIEEGDVILDVNQKPVKDATEVIRYLRKGANLLRLYRQGAIVIIGMSSSSK